jgi:hypothetical protein
VTIVLPGTNRILNLAEVRIFSSPTPPPPPSPPRPPFSPPSPPPPPYPPGTAFVSNTVALTSALADTAVGRIILAPGTYFLSGELSVTRSVIIEAEVARSVVLNGGNAFRVLNVNPGSSGVVQLIGLNITGGQSLGASNGGWGGGVLVLGGSVTISSCTINGNTASGVRSHAQNIPSPRWESC